jgi:hypothetical protein
VRLILKGRLMSQTPARLSSVRAASIFASAIALALSASGAVAAPPIRTNATNQVPACVTPERLMAFLAERNAHLDPRYDNIASLYKLYGQGWHVRWDYAFFQMAIETNFLKFRRGDGSLGDVRATQNNFAGIGATGRGAHGERFRDVATGVHAQIQHLVAYSGERLAQPIATRTRQNQDDIIRASQRLGRPVTFGDLARRWATDRQYGKSIDFIAGLYSARYCSSEQARSAEDIVPPAPQPAHRRREYPFQPPSGLGGPKPDMLAGPKPEAQAGGEVLPWLAKPARPKTSAAKKHPTALKSKKSHAKHAAKHQLPVKSAKTRTDHINKEHLSPSSTKVVAAAGSGSIRSDGRLNAKTTAVPGTSVAGTMDQTTPLPTFRIAPPGAEPSRLGGPLPTNLAPPPAATRCHIVSASYGGTKTLLLRSTNGGETQMTLLTVLDGFEKSMFENYAKADDAAAQIVGEYPSRKAALVDARANCPSDN